ncbi:MAG: alpha/beta hydrolase [Sphingomicrobium sp.]
MDETVAPRDTALQHEPSRAMAPRPLPLFLELVRNVAEQDPALAKRALDGLARYAREQRAPAPPQRPPIGEAGGAVLRDHGGNGPPLILIPSMINPPHVLDLPGQSLADALSAQHHVMLLDWGLAGARADIDLAGHIETILLPLVERIGREASLVGYCLGGTMALAVANLTPVARVATLAAPWCFSAYPQDARQALAQLWERSAPAARLLGVLPTEVLQLAFWSLDPQGMVAKFARLAEEPDGSETVRRFIVLEDWANDGEPLPVPSARELIEQLFLADCTGRGEWCIGGIRVVPDPVRALHFTARADRIVPAASAPPGPSHAVSSGHVGMIVGGRAAELLHAPLLDFLAN